MHEIAEKIPTPLAASLNGRRSHHGAEDQGGGDTTDDRHHKFRQDRHDAINPASDRRES
jgi:hypothetical protein